MEIKKLSINWSISTSKGKPVGLTYEFPDDKLFIACGEKLKILKEPNRNESVENFGGELVGKELDSDDVSFPEVHAKVLLNGREFSWDYEEFYGRVIMDDLDDDDLEDGWDDLDEPDCADSTTIQGIIDWITEWCEPLESYIKDEDDDDDYDEDDE